MISQFVILLLVVSVNSLPLEEFFPFNRDRVCLIDAITGLVHTSNKIDSSGKPISEISMSTCQEFRLSPNDDASSQNINISYTFPFFAKRFKNVFINTNGVISFTAPVTRFTPDPFPISGRFLIAPFWADVDTRGTGEIYFKETTDSALLNKANDVIQDATHQAAGLSRFEPSWMLIATWYKVGYFSSHTDQTNTFQAVLVTDRRYSFTIFNYLDDGINWNKGDASSIPAQVGFNFGGQKVEKYTFSDSRTEAITDIETKSNKNVNGRFVFRTDSAKIVPRNCSNLATNVSADPPTPSIINGGIMKLTDPCFNATLEKITCIFTDEDGVINFKKRTTLNIDGLIVNTDLAVCPMPLFRKLGFHSVTIKLQNGRTFVGQFEVVQPLRNNPPVIKVLNKNDENETFSTIKYNEMYTIKWNSAKLNRDEFHQDSNATVQLEIETHSFRMNKWNTVTLEGVFKVTNMVDNEGFANFMQKANLPSGGFEFYNRVIVLLKRTKYLTIMYTSSLFTFLPNPKGKTALKGYCNWWLHTTRESVSSDTLTSCPCTRESITFNGNYSADATCLSDDSACHENVGAVRCYIKKLNNTMHLGQQCCYDSNGKYIKTPKPAGSADYYHVKYSYLKHQQSDYFPYIACCFDAKYFESGDVQYCNEYYKKRPSDNSMTCANIKTKSGKAGGVGDPHFITLDGKHYTFNGLGEYVLINMQYGEFIIQIQTKQATNQDGLPIKATSMSIIAMKQKNKPTVQAQLDNIDGIAVLVENEFNNFGYNILDFEHAPSRQFDGGEVNVGPRFSRHFSFDNGVVVIVQAVNDILSFELSIPEVYYGNTQGLLGVWNDNQDDDFRRPDGTIIPINSSEDVIFHQFGEKWSVDTASSILIFEDAESTTTKDTTYVPLFETPTVDDATAALIEETCGNNSECAYDIAVTGNVDVGRETLDDIEEHMMILNQDLPIICDPPCQNDAPCVANDTCNCNTGYNGTLCEEKIIRCDTPCNNGGTCIGLEQCSCPKDYFGQHCTNYDPCVLSPCEHSCTVINNTYSCYCSEDYILADNGFSCIKCAAFNSQGEVNATWQVALCNASNKNTICSGTAISDQWVLTSARCVCNNGSGIEDLSIRYGKKRTCYYRDRGEKRRSASQIYCYPNFDPKRVTVDLAIIKLKTPLPVSTLKNYPPLCFDTRRKDKERFFSGNKVEVFGWGRIGELVSIESTLQSTGNVTVDVTLECRNIFKNEGVEFDTGMMCTIANTTSACTGNYGSGLITKDDNNKILLGGIVNRVTKVCGDKDSYVAHTRLSTKVATKWIRSVIQPSTYLDN